MLVCSLVFFGLVLALAPGQNCTSDGRCYPALVWIARLVGGVFSLGFAMQLLTNPSRGVHYRPASGALHWWAASRGRDLLGHGSIHPTGIARIEIDTSGEDTRVRLIGLDGQPVPGFSENVLPASPLNWAQALTKRWPDIELRQIG